MSTATLTASGVNLVTLFVNQMERTKNFYTDLGFQVVEQFSPPTGDFVFLRPPRGGACIALQDAPSRINKPTQADVPVESGGVLIGIEVDDAAEAYKDLQKVDGIEFRTDVVPMAKGLTFGIKDPEGNYVQLYDVDPEAKEFQRKLGIG